MMCGMIDMKKIKIRIAGVPYNIVTDNDTDYVVSLANEIDSKISSVMDSGSYISPTQATVIALLEYADSVKKLTDESNDMKIRLKEYLADAAQAKSERDMLRREINKMKKGESV